MAKIIKKIPAQITTKLLAVVQGQVVRLEASS